MNPTTICPRCGHETAPADTECTACGRTVTDNATPRAANDDLRWCDGQGKNWRVAVEDETLHLDGADAEYSLPRDCWRDAIQFEPLGRQVVIRVDLGDREIGFLVPMPDARRLFAAMGETVPAPEAEEPAASAPPPPARSAGNPLWPKMTALPIVALCLSMVSFVPVVGFVLGLGAAVLAIRTLRATHRTPVWQHVRLMSKLTLAMAALGLLTCGVATIAWLRPDHGPDPVVLAMGREVTWSWGARIAALVMILIALTFHEAAHAIAAWWCGDGYARSLGRVTLNPLAHLDPFGTVILPLILVLTNLPPFGYARPVPVQLAGMRKLRRAHIFISAAGPLSNLMQAAICLTLLMLIGSLLSFAPPAVRVTNFSAWQPIVEIRGLPGGAVLAGVALMLKLGVIINVLLACFNLLPIPPLDGSWIAEHLAPSGIARFFVAIRPYGFLIFVGLLLTGWLGYLLAPAIDLLIMLQLLVARVTGL